MESSHNTHRVFWSFILLHAIFLNSSSLSESTNETDRLALLAFKDSISKDPNSILSSWNHSLHFCRWMGVTCSRRHHQRVTILNLTGYSLVGHLSPHIGNLSFLRRINLSKNKFQGEIPQEISHLFRLQILNLTKNSLQGEISSNLSHCSELLTIHMKQNQLVGKLPAELGSLSKLIFLSVAFNNLKGSIPPSFGNLSSLYFLDVGINNFKVKIPNQLGQLASVTFFEIGGNQFLGTIPSSIYNPSSLQLLGVANNRLRGSISPNLGHAFPRLRWLLLGENEFTGAIPISLSNASSLKLADFSSSMKLQKVALKIKLAHLGSRDQLGTFLQYGMGGKASTHGDVYSYGIFLLEMITGKRPTDGMFKDNYSLHHFAKSAFPKQVMEIINPRLLLEDAKAIQGSENRNNLRNIMHDCLVSLVSVGVSCFVESPKERMEMKDIVMEFCITLSSDLTGSV